MILLCFCFKIYYCNHLGFQLLSFISCYSFSLIYMSEATIVHNLKKRLLLVYHMQVMVAVVFQIQSHSPITSIVSR